MPQVGWLLPPPHTQQYSPEAPEPECVFLSFPLLQDSVVSASVTPATSALSSVQGQATHGIITTSHISVHTDIWKAKPT